MLDPLAKMVVCGPAVMGWKRQLPAHSNTAIQRFESVKNLARQSCPCDVVKDVLAVAFWFTKRAICLHVMYYVTTGNLIDGPKTKLS